jgi:hypothetical protein
MNIFERAMEVAEGFMREPWDSPGLIEALDQAGLLTADRPDDGEIMAVRDWGNNSHLIEDLFTLGYLTDEMTILDPTYGKGTFWKRHQPRFLTKSDLDPRFGDVEAYDFTALPCPDCCFDAVVFDPDYKMQGTSSNAGPASSNGAYGMDREYRPVDTQLGIIGQGLAECVRVTKPKGVIVVKCMDQIVSGAPVWQTDRVTTTMDELGCDKIAEFMLLGHRKQPTHDKCRECGGEGRLTLTTTPVGDEVIDCLMCAGTGRVPRRQVHERRNYSTLLLFRKVAS